MTKFNTFKICCVTLTVLACWASTSRATQIKIDAGWDLFQTEPGTTFFGQPFQGVPIGNFNFGGSNGVQNTGPTDTIIQRLSDVTATNVPGKAPTISLQMLDLQLVTPTPVDLGAGVNFYYLTLQSNRPVPAVATIGQMDTTFTSGTGGTFDSFFDVFFDLHVGSLNGPIVSSSDVLLDINGVPWQRTVDDPNDLTINGVNQNLNGADNSADFWPQGNFNAQGPSGTTDVLHNTVVPEPGTLSLAALGLTGFLGLFKRRLGYHR